MYSQIRDEQEAVSGAVSLVINAEKMELVPA
jgi:hypothetical protein